MTTEKYESPPLEVTIARAYRDRIGGNCPYFSFGLRRVVVCKGDWHYDDEFHGLMLDAKEQGAVNQQEWDEFWGVHTVSRGEDRQDGSVTYVTVDIAITVEDHHVNKGASRADILRRITGERTIPTIIGAFIGGDSVRRLAQERGVSLIHNSLKDAKLDRYFREDALEEIGRGKLPLQEGT